MDSKNMGSNQIRGASIYAHALAMTPAAFGVWGKGGIDI